MSVRPFYLLCAAILAAGPLLGQGNPDFRIRARFRTADNGQWGANESVGSAEFRVRSRFAQIYYGGVTRSDEYRFRVQLDFTQISGFATEFAGSPYNTDLDVYISDSFVGRMPRNSVGLGMAILEYDSRNPTPPATLLPDGFPETVDVFETVRAFASADVLPAIGDPPPVATPMFAAELVERFARGDVNQDGHVDSDDFPFLRDSYDPFHAIDPHVGPAAGDFTGDNRSDAADYALLVQNWDNSHDPPPEPGPTAFRAGDIDRDGDVDLADLSLELGAFGSCSGGAGYDPLSDLDGDGCVDLGDLAVLLTHFGETP